jgi:uncharacterized protein YjbI with pentapeptide repeats
MANPEHLDLLRQGVPVWNDWRFKVSSVCPDLRDADLNGAILIVANLCKAALGGANLRLANLQGAHLDGTDLQLADLREAVLCGADFVEANLSGANLCRANLSKANLSFAKLGAADLQGANLSGANLGATDFGGANLSGAELTAAFLAQANLSGADLNGANLGGADLSGANLSGAKLGKADLSKADLSKANLAKVNLSGANLSEAILVETCLVDAILTDCRIYGISAWNVGLSASTKQQDLIITAPGEPDVTADDLEIAQFIYLLVHNEKLQRVIDTVTSKVVLILGRFALSERKLILDALRDELRKRNYVPVVFDFEKPRSGTTVNTITLLARMARFVIADISDAKSVLMELQAIVPQSPKLPVQPIIVAGQEEPGMFDSFVAYPWFLKVHRYNTQDQLLADLEGQVIDPVEAKVAELRSGP